MALSCSILGTLVKVDKVIVEYRHWIKNNWIYMAKMLPHPESYTHDDSITTPPTRREKAKVSRTANWLTSLLLL